MGLKSFATTDQKLSCDYTGKGQNSETMVTDGARSRRGRWRRNKARRKLQKTAKDSAKVAAPDEGLRKDQPDRLLLSALKYWEVERDLIEERMASVRSATAS
jgi:hypothetical protein